MTAVTETSAFQITCEDPTDPSLELLHARHTEAMHADTPPESIHMLPASALKAPGISFFVLRDRQGEALAMGALKRIDDHHAEIKSMHVLAERRGTGLSRQMLTHMQRFARTRGYRRLSLETGAQPSFAAARALYCKEGFTECPPFEGYWPDPNSIFMTKVIG